MLLVGGLDRSLLNFRGELIREIIAAGHSVVAAAPAEHADVPAKLAALGARFAAISLNRAGLNPLAEWATRRKMAAMIGRERPDIVLAYTIKPVLHAMPAASSLGTAGRFALITGLGAAFHTPGWKGKVLAHVASQSYRRALRNCTRVIVQNEDIADFFLKHEIVASRENLAIVRGSGVDVSHFHVQPQPPSPLSFLFVGRLLKDKGLLEFVEAARRIRARSPEIKFVVAGDLDTNPAAITRAQLESWIAENVIEYRSFMTDVRPALRDCSVFVLPSYHEGLPRSVLEAMASGRPIVTTDTIGCRETIFDLEPRAESQSFRSGGNGLLVPVRSTDALTAALRHFIERPELVAAMGRRSRELAAVHFDVRRINAEMLRLMQLSPS